MAKIIERDARKRAAEDAPQEKPVIEIREEDLEQARRDPAVKEFAKRARRTVRELRRQGRLS
jgi:hypothetical protein